MPVTHRPRQWRLVAEVGHLEREQIWNGNVTGMGTDQNPFPFLGTFFFHQGTEKEHTRMGPEWKKNENGKKKNGFYSHSHSTRKPWLPIFASWTMRHHSLGAWGASWAPTPATSGAQARAPMTCEVTHLAPHDHPLTSTFEGQEWP